jgi:alkanesulfonate monooxygenase SsuD/methylene tetrahydromethanopterin reductase-like flavin-dependent oxidoreductase (luciferase family)
MGAGWNEGEHAMYGFSFPERSIRLERFAEQVEIVHRQWTEDTFDFEGRHYRLEDCRALPKPVQDPHPPLIIGGSAGRATVEPAVRWADEYNTIFASVETLGERRRKLDQACERAGRDPATLRFSLMTTCLVGADRAELRERGRRVAAVSGHEVDPEAFLAEQRETGLVGTVDEAVEKLRELESVGVERIFLQHLDHRDLEMVELIGREIVAGV